MYKSWCSRFVLPLIASFTTAAAADVILHVTLADQALIDTRDVRARVERLARAHPEDRVESIVLRASMQDFFRKEHRARLRTELRTELEALNLGGDLVRTLVINAHGTGGYVSSSIEPLGKLFANGPNAKFRETFEPLRGRLRRNARVVLLSCSILAGERASIEKRVEGLMSWLGATDGTLTGFTGSLAAEDQLWRRPDPRSWDWLNLTRASAAASVYGYFMDWTTAPIVAGATLAPAVYQLGVNAWVEWDLRRSKRELAKSPDHNRGVSLRLRNGLVVGAHEVVVPRDMDRILDCEARLDVGERTWRTNGLGTFSSPTTYP